MNTKEIEENPKDYCHGGYHPVKLGDLFENRYLVIRKLGWGSFSTVWLCQDLQDTRFVALKIVRSAPLFAKVALREIELLKCVEHHNTGHHHKNAVVRFLDDFIITGVNGTHICMVFNILGQNLSKIKKIPLAQVKNIIKSLLENLDYLHNTCKIIHTDIKPENVCLNNNGIVDVSAAQWENLSKNISSDQLSAAKDQLRAHNASCNQTCDVAAMPLVAIADLGNSCWVDRHFADVIQTRFYRAPEVIIGKDYGPSADVWSTACLAFELATGDLLFPVLFDGKYRGSDVVSARANDFLHLDLIMELYGRGIQTERVVFNAFSCGLFKKLKERYDASDARQFTDFLQPMLIFDPSQRSSVKDALEHQWLKDLKPHDRSIRGWLVMVFMILMFIFIVMLN
uniref:non-specific serine/threonine protein kinase n=1 Tax=Strigamia maritima TaxID=126957 RepID=T1JE83_STRMM